MSTPRPLDEKTSYTPSSSSNPSRSLTPTAIDNEKKEKKEPSADVLTVADEPLVSPGKPVFPEGGMRAWLTVLGSFLIQFTCFGYINSFGVYQDYYVRVYLRNFTPSDIGWIGGIQIFLNFSVSAVTGKVFDRGYYRYLLAASVILQALALFMLSLSHENSYYQVFLTNGVLVGLASGISYVPSLGIAGHYFQRRRSLAVGLISSGSALGAIIHPIMLNKLFAHPSIGFNKGVRISAGMNTLLLLLSFVLSRTNPSVPPKPDQRYPIKDWINPKKDPAYSVYFFSSIPVFLGIFFPVFYLQLNAQTHGVSEDLAFYSTSILNAASFLGRALPGFLAPKLGVFNLGTFATVATGIVTLTFPLVKSSSGHDTVIFGVFVGLFSGGCIALTPAMLAHLAKDAGEIGTRMGMYFALGGLLGLFATPIAGALLGSEYNWIRPIIFAGVTTLVGGVMYGLSGIFYARDQRIKQEERDRMEVEAEARL